MVAVMIGHGTALHPARDLLAEIGLRATKPRIALVELLYGKGFRHVSAESLYEELVRSGAPGSIGSVYRNWGSDRVAAITANFQATTSIGNLVSISSSNIP